MQVFGDIVNNKYNEMTKNISNLLKETEYIIENTINKNDENILDIYSTLKKEKKILSVKYEIMGIYDYSCNLFSWDNMMILTNKNLNNLSKKVKKYKKNIKEMIITKQYKDIDYMERILYYISNSVFFIEQNNLLNLIQFSCYSLYSDNILGVLSQDKMINGKIYGLHYFITEIIST
jgi:hypothetical protein